MTLSVPWTAVFVALAVWQATPKPRDLTVGPIKQSGLRRDRKALVIGNDSYVSAGVLKNARNDARSVAKVLGGLGFDVVKLEDVDAAALDSAVVSFVQDVKQNDILFFFFAGHGIQIEQSNYIVPINVRAKSEVDLRHSCYGIDRVLDHFETSGARLSLIVIDACRNNPLRRTRSAGAGLAPVDVRLGTLIAFSAGPGQTADDNPRERNSLFTKHLVRTLREPLDLLAVFRKTRELVYRESGGAQRPWIHEDLIGEVSLVSAPHVASARPASHDDTLTQGRRFFNRGDYSSAAKAFELARREDPENPFAHNGAGAAYLQIGEFARAVECFKRALGLRPGYAAAHYNRGLAYLRNAQYQLAIDDFTWAIEDEPLNPTLFNLRGRAYFAVRNYRAAIDDLTRSSELNPSDPLPLHTRGLVYYRLGNLDKALRDLNGAIERQSSLIEVYEDRARTWEALGDMKNAAADRRFAETLRRQTTRDSRP